MYYLHYTFWLKVSYVDCLRKFLNHSGGQGTICNAVSAAALHHAGPERGNVAVVMIICPNQYSVTFFGESRLPLHDG